MNRLFIINLATGFFSLVLFVLMFIYLSVKMSVLEVEHQFMLYVVPFAFSIFTAIAVFVLIKAIINIIIYIISNRS